MTGVAERYRAMVAGGELRPDPDQQVAVAALDALAAALAAPKPGLFARLLRRKAPAPGAAKTGGVYLWGGVGRGKSMLMDLAYEQIPVAPKRRVHFHEFMIEVHARLGEARRTGEGDPIPAVVDALAARARFLAFDEMVINDAADAMILSRLFARLLDAGVSVVATSNRPPADLYKHGLNRDLFLPFVALLESRMTVVELNGPTDYRLQRLAGVETWHVPNGPTATAALSGAFFRLTDFAPEDAANVPSEELDVGGGRTLHVPKSLKGVAVFSFKRLCGEARGAADYLAIARRFHTVIVVGIPKLGPDARNEAARFVTLVDALYEHRTKLLAVADAEPDALYVRGTGAFEFQRTASRLAEMGSLEYLGAGHGKDVDASSKGLRP